VWLAFDGVCHRYTVNECVGLLWDIGVNEDVKEQKACICCGGKPENEKIDQRFGGIKTFQSFSKTKS
jgi:hypothetical protein